VVGNSSMGDELFSSTPAGAGGVSINTGSDYYKFTNNWVCGNLSSGDGGGVSHIGFIKNGTIEHNTIIFNQTTNPSITTNGGGLLVMGAPDADPTTCGVSTDLDCLPAPGEIPPSDGSGPGLIVNANLILGNAADSGSGGGLRLQHVNGTDVLNIPSRGASHSAACTVDLGAAGGNRPTDESHCYWNSVSVTNNIIVNNVAGWDGGGAALVDALAVNVVNNTIASNDSTASSGTLLQSLFAPLASAASPTTNVICGAGNGSSCPQIAGLVSVNDSPVLVANIKLLAATPGANPFRCPTGHGGGAWTGTSYTVAGATVPSCVSYSIPEMVNDVVWQNRSFFIGVGGKATGLNQNQQNQVTLYPKGSTTPAANQLTTGSCPAGSGYWDLGFRGDTDVTAHVASGFAPIYSVMTTTAYNPGSATNNTHNSANSPSFTSQYCNGSRSPPELGLEGGIAVPPGVNEFNAFPNPVFTLSPSGVVDEGNNWVNVRWGPLALTNPVNFGTATQNLPLGDYAPVRGSSAIDAGVANVNVGSGTLAAPRTDFFGNVRPAGAGYDVGAIEVALAPLAVLNVTGGPLAFGNQVVNTTSTAQTLTLRNTGNAQATGIALAFSSTVYSRPAGAAGGTCGATLAANSTCSISVVFAPTAPGASSGTLTITASVAVAGSPVALSGTGLARVVSATLTPTSWAAPTTTRGCGGACPVQVFVLTNTGNVPLTGVLQGVLGGTNASEFSVVRLVSTCGPAGGGQLLGQTTLAPNGACIVTVRFSPVAAQTIGAKTATISVTDLAGTQTSTLTGTAR